MRRVLHRAEGYSFFGFLNDPAVHEGGAWTEAMAALVTLRGEYPDGESREFPVVFSGKPLW